MPDLKPVATVAYSSELGATSYSRPTFHVVSSKSTSVVASVWMSRMIGMKLGGPGGTKPTNGSVCASVSCVLLSRV